MRIGYLVPEFPAQTHAFFWRELTAIRALGHEVRLFSTRRPALGSCEHEFAPAATAQTCYVMPPEPRTVAATMSTRLGRLPAVSRYLAACERTTRRDAARRAGIAVCAATMVGHARRLGLEHLHIHSCADAAHLGAIGRLLGGPPFSLTLHGDLPVYGRDHALKMADAAFVSAVTQPLREQVMAVTGWPSERVPVVWMGVDTERFAPPHEVRDPIRDALPVRLLTVARLNHTKGHRFALQAVRRALDQGVSVEYLIAGSGPELPEIEREIRELGLQDSVRLTGAVSEGGVLELLHSSDVFVLPSFGLGEAAPVSVMEAMACGLPVVSTVIGGTPDMITDGVDGLLVAQQDPEALTSALVRLARDHALRAELGRAARTRALDVFDYRENARKLVEDILGAHRPTTSSPRP